MSLSNRINTDSLLASINIVDVIGHYVPLKKEGNEQVACCPFHTEETPSFKVNQVKQLFHCFGCGEGGSAIDFVMKYEQVDFKEACKRLGAGELNFSEGTSTRKLAKAKKRSPWQPFPVVPSNATTPDKAHIKRGLPDIIYTYRNASGNVIGYVYRFMKSGGGKETLPLVWALNSDTGAAEWRWLSFAQPRPMYGLDRLAARPNAPVLLVEGEKCADVPGKLVVDYILMAWPGGGKAVDKVNWSPLTGRRVVLWPDCDAKRVPLTREEKAVEVLQASKPLLPADKQPGMLAMAKIAVKLVALDCVVETVNIPRPGAVLDGWDIADAVADEWDAEQLAAFVANTSVAGVESVCRGMSRVANIGVPANDQPPLEAYENEKMWRDSSAHPRDKGGGGGFDFTHSGMLSNYVLIYGTETIFDRQRKSIMTIGALSKAAGKRSVDWWLENDERCIVEKECVVFDPMENSDPLTTVNLFNGMPIKPREGTCELMLQLLYYLVGKNNQVFDWILKWAAYPLQNLGAKMQTAVIFHGPEGTGKNTFWDVVRKIYGEHGGTITQSELDSTFTGWASKKMFMIGNEVVSRAEMYHQKGRLKNMITEHEWYVNEKHLPGRYESNHCNFVFLSNTLQPVVPDPDDRRYMVIWTPPALDTAYYCAVGNEINNGGVEALYHFLLNYELSDFSPHAKPIMTEAKQDLIDTAMDNHYRFYLLWIANRLPVRCRPVESEWLYKTYKHWCDEQGERAKARGVIFKTAMGKRMAKSRTTYLANSGKKQGTFYHPAAGSIADHCTQGKNESEAVYLGRCIDQFKGEFDSWSN